MKKLATSSAMEPEHLQRLATLGADVENVKREVDVLATETRAGFTRIFDKLDKVSQPRPTPWNLIFTGLGVGLTMICAVAGGLGTLILALAAWANAYFTELVGKVDYKAESFGSRLDQLERRMNYGEHESDLSRRPAVQRSNP
jgi:hypothetical protein